MDDTDRLDVASMSLEEINRRLLDAFRNGKLSMDLKGPVLGFAASMKRGRGPSPKQIEFARRLVTEVRKMNGHEPEHLIDRGDFGK